jgi:hypothetical protein
MKQWDGGSQRRTRAIFLSAFARVCPHPIAWLLWLLLLLITLSGVAAQPMNRAGVVVDFGNGRLQTACVTFPEPSLTGLELLQRSGLPVAIAQQPGGALVCQIGDTGCPADDCFCACHGGDCAFWNYWHAQAGNWAFSPIGAAQYTVQPGTIDGWAWGGNATAPSSLPSLGLVCHAQQHFLPLVLRDKAGIGDWGLEIDHGLQSPISNLQSQLTQAHD